MSLESVLMRAVCPSGITRVLAPMLPKERNAVCLPVTVLPLTVTVPLPRMKCPSALSTS